MHPEKCILKAASEGPVTAKLFEREDGYSLLIVDGNSADQSNEDFIRGLLIGKTEEQDRIRQKFHDDVAPQIMAAAFATEGLAERVRQGGSQDAEELKRLADLISDLVAVFGTLWAVTGQAAKVRTFPRHRLPGRVECRLRGSPLE